MREAVRGRSEFLIENLGGRVLIKEFQHVANGPGPTAYRLNDGSTITVVSHWYPHRLTISGSA
jgi:hypothetical protein